MTTNQNFLMIISLFFALNLSSCFYYKDMPSEWTTQVAMIDDCDTFNGEYALSYDNPSLLESQDYNDLQYFRNDPPHNRGKVKPPWITSIKFEVSGEKVDIVFFSFGKQVYQSHFDSNSFECQNNTLILDMTNHYEAEDIVQAYFIPEIILYKSKFDEIFVRRKESAVGLIAIVVPVVGSGDYWFKLTKI